MVYFHLFFFSFSSSPKPAFHEEREKIKKRTGWRKPLVSTAVQMETLHDSRSLINAPIFLHRNDPQSVARRRTVWFLPHALSLMVEGLKGSSPFNHTMALAPFRRYTGRIDWSLPRHRGRYTLSTDHAHGDYPRTRPGAAVSNEHASRALVVSGHGLGSLLLRGEWGFVMSGGLTIVLPFDCVGGGPTARSLASRSGWGGLSSVSHDDHCAGWVATLSPAVIPTVGLRVVLCLA